MGSKPGRPGYVSTAVQEGITQMRAVRGYLTDDGTYFDTKEEAALYDSLHALRFAATNVGVDPDKGLIFVDGCKDAIRRYIDAKEAYNEAEGRQDEVDGGRWADRAGTGTDTAAPLTINNAEFLRAEADPSSVQQQPVDEPQHVPDVGSSVSSEAIPDKCEEHGIGSRRAYARSVRSSSHMATASTAALATARGSRGEETVRSSKK